MLYLEHTVSFTPAGPALHESKRDFFDIRMSSVPYLLVNLYNQNYSLFTSLLFFNSLVLLTIFWNVSRFAFFFNIIYF